MKLDAVVPILQVGLSGFSFLLAYLTYRIIAREQLEKEPRAAILKSARYFFYLCILLALIVGTFRVGERMLSDIDPEELARCRESMELLESRNKRAETLEQLRNAVNDHEKGCSELLRKWSRIYD
jgi:TRAP-type C4-dicarboxylate transport system permease small subunit